jgi:SAM-dependent methyltransferase
MTIKKDSLANQVRNAYDRLEPGEADTWNPLFSEFEIAYRLSLFYWLTQALLLSPLSLESLNVLDLGCGNGRSTRMYIDLGLRPEQLMGVDVRLGTIDLARKLNPAIALRLMKAIQLPLLIRALIGFR